MSGSPPKSIQELVQKLYIPLNFTVTKILKHSKIKTGIFHPKLPNHINNQQIVSLGPHTSIDKWFKYQLKAISILRQLKYSAILKPDTILNRRSTLVFITLSLTLPISCVYYFDY